MNGIVATEKELTIVKTLVPETISCSKFMESSLLQWGSEMTFLKRKYQLLEQLVELNHLRAQPNPNQEDLLRECSLFLHRALPAFENQYNKSLGFLSGLELPDTPIADRLGRFRRLQQEWNDLQVKNRQLEMKLLHSFVEKFPVIII